MCGGLWNAKQGQILTVAAHAQSAREPMMDSPGQALKCSQFEVFVSWDVGK